MYIRRSCHGRRPPRRSLKREREPEQSTQSISPIDSILSLHRTIGNHAVQRLVQSGALRAKLNVNTPNDVYEQEADRVASQVVHMSNLSTQPKPAVSSQNHGSPVQRMCPECEKEMQQKPIEEKNEGLQFQAVKDDKKNLKMQSADDEIDLQMQSIEDEKEAVVQSNKSATCGLEVTSSVESRIQSQRGSGHALPETTRSFFEPRFGQSFSDVRIHTDSSANTLNRALNARAFMTGQDIFFRRGEYNPSGSKGQALFAHELTHVVQQNGPTIPVNPHVQLLQRTIGDGHDLQSPRFAMDPVLEACFDNERVLTVGNSGEGVVKVQQALVDAGFALPRFGVDGIFGSETRGAVKQFQVVFGLLVDGVVGQETMGRLDEHYRNPNPPPICAENSVQSTMLSFGENTDRGIPPSQCRVPGLGNGGKGCPTPSTSGVTGVHEAFDNFSGRSKIRYGVGEIVNLSFESPLSKGQPADKKAVPHAGLKWVKTSGPGRLAATDIHAGTGSFEANQNAGTVELELRVVVGPCADSTVAKVNFRIVKPNDVKMTRESGTNLRHIHDTWSVGFLAQVFLRPKDVSFSRVEFQEGSVKAKRDGWLSNHTPEMHPAGSCHNLRLGGWCLVAHGNSSTGSRVRTTDEAWSGAKRPPFGKGSFEWAIPGLFRVGNGSAEKFTTLPQKMTAANDGTATIKKKGAGPFSRVPGDPDSSYF